MPAHQFFTGDNYMAENITLKGITRNHSRGFTPMAVTARRFAELKPGVNITPGKQMLQQFAIGGYNIKKQLA